MGAKATEEANLEAIKLWQIDGSEVTSLDASNQMESEGLLEDILVENPRLLMEGMELVGRQTPTEGGPLDLLSVDEDGRLCVFELKRGTLSRDAVAQIIDYASYLDGMELVDLATHISNRSIDAPGIEEINNFEDWYNGRHGELESLKPLRLFLVGLGVDDRTERMVRFLAHNSGMDISLLTFHGFIQDGKTLLAKQVEVEAVQDSGIRRSRSSLSAAERRARFEDLIDRCGVGDLLTGVRSAFRENWPEHNEFINAGSLSIRMPEYVDSRLRQRAYAAIYFGHSSATLVFYRNISNLGRDAFLPMEAEIRESRQDGHNPLTETEFEVRLRLHSDNWNEHRHAFSEVLRNLHTAYIEASFGESGPSDLGGEALGMFRADWPGFNESLHRLGIDIIDRTGSKTTQYARVDATNEEPGVVFYPAAANLCRNKFGPLIDAIGCKTWPHGRNALTDKQAEIQFVFSSKEWEDHKEALAGLVRTVYAAWEENQKSDGDA